MQHTNSFVDRISALKEKVRTADETTVQTLKTIAAVAPGAGEVEGSEILSRCPGWGEFSQWTQWFN
ncbi:MAG TPA: hypothetical protein P5121_28480 [Caldilineaceae bacterium]|nr:hypothetical protein [Caldilineaceae bacterium]